MKRFNNINEILDFAIGEEQAAVDFYIMLGAQSKASQTKKIFQEFAEEEMQHKAHLLDVKPSPSMSYQDALTLAMKKEKAAFRMYTVLADKATDPVVKTLFLKLAQEESKHKLRFEIEYDDYILKEN